MSCSDNEKYVYQPPNPPVGLAFYTLESGGDYLLAFHSSNKTNERFGGYLIFIDPDKSGLDSTADFSDMSGPEKETLLSSSAYYEQGSSPILSGTEYNKEIEEQVVVVFSNSDQYGAGDTVDCQGETYTVTAKLSAEEIIPGQYITLRSFLIDQDENIIDVSSPGNIVLIE